LFFYQEKKTFFSALASSKSGWLSRSLCRRFEEEEINMIISLDEMKVYMKNDDGDDYGFLKGPFYSTPSQFCVFGRNS